MSPAAWSSADGTYREENSEKPKPQRHEDRGEEARATIRFLRERNSRHRQRTQNEKQGTDARSVADRTYRGMTAPKPRPNDGMWRQQQYRNNRVQFIESQVKEGGQEACKKLNTKRPNNTRKVGSKAHRNEKMTRIEPRKRIYSTAFTGSVVSNDRGPALFHAFQE